MLKDMGKQAQSSAQKCFDDLIEETRQIRKDFLSRQWKEEPVNKSELAKFWKQIENLSYLYSIWERWKHNETLYAKAIEFKRLGKIAKKFGIEAGPTDFRKETADKSRLSQIDFLEQNRVDTDLRLRDWTEKIWRVIPEKMKTAATEYTRGSGRFNRTLNGYGWDWNAFPTGIEAAKKLVGKENVDNIKYLDMLMEASRMKQDMKVVRGAGREWLGALLGLNHYEKRDLKLVMDKLRDAIQNGTEGKALGYTSTSVTEGDGFQNEEFLFEIIVPKGTKGLYAEPFSAFTDSGKYGKDLWDGTTVQQLEKEMELIIARNTSYRFLGFSLGAYGQVIVEMVVTAQD